MQHQSLLDGLEAVNGALLRRAFVFVGLRDIVKVTLVEEAHGAVDREQALSLLQSLETETRGMLGAASPLARLRGRFWIYDGDLPRARDELSLALKQALHRDTDVGWIRFELLLVAAQLKDRFLLKRCLLQLDEFSPRSPPDDPEELERWLALEWVLHFPPQYRFAECR